MAEQPGGPCEGADRIAGTHFAGIDHKISRLTAPRTEVVRMADCRHSSVGECRVIEVLAEHGQCLRDHG